MRYSSPSANWYILPSAPEMLDCAAPEAKSGLSKPGLFRIHHAKYVSSPFLTWLTRFWPAYPSKAISVIASGPVPNVAIGARRVVA